MSPALLSSLSQINWRIKMRGWNAWPIGIRGIRAEAFPHWRKHPCMSVFESLCAKCLTFHPNISLCSGSTSCKNGVVWWSRESFVEWTINLKVIDTIKGTSYRRNPLVSPVRSVYPIVRASGLTFFRVCPCISYLSFSSLGSTEAGLRPQ